MERILVLAFRNVNLDLLEKDKNPNADPNGTKFGFLKYGGDNRTEICDLSRVW